ncbi:MAG: alpha/beta fold hydrolase [Sphingobium sp.]
MTETISIFRRTALRWVISGIAAAAAPGQKLYAASATGSSPSRLSVRAAGSTSKSGDDLLLIPGLASGPAVWSRLAAQVPGHRLHFVHVAGFAGKAAGPNAKGPLLDPLVDELTRYIRANGLRAPALIGHSMGGTLAMKLALRRDIRIGRLMVVDMLPEGSAMLGGTAQGMGYLAQQLNGYFTGTKAGRQLLADMVMQNPAARDSDPMVIAQALTELAQTDLSSGLAGITCPLSVVYALSGDAAMQAAQARRYRTAYATARQPTFTGIGPSGHLVMLDQPTKFAAAVARFLR